MQKKWLILCFAILLRVHHEYTWVNLGADKLDQIISAYALLNGYGTSLRYASEEDLSQTTTSIIKYWAPSFAIFIAPLLYLTDDIVFSSLCLVSLGLILFLFSWFKIIALFQENLAKNTIIFVLSFWAIANVPFSYLGATDLISLAFYSFSIYLAIKFINSFKNQIYVQKNVLHITLLSAVSFATCSFRYAYYPLAFSLPIVFYIVAVLKESALLRWANTYFIMVLCLVGLLLFYQIYYTSYLIPDGNSLLEADVVIHWENLLGFNPLFINTLFHAPILTRMFGNITWEEMAQGKTSSNFLPFLLFVFSILIVFILAKSIRFGLGQWVRKSNATPALGIFYLIGAITIIINISFTAFLSLSYPIHNSWSYPWTPVMETRFFAPTLTIFFIFIVLFLFDTKNKLKKFTKILIISLLSISFCLNIAHYLYLLTKFSLWDYRHNSRMLSSSFLDDYYTLKDIKNKNDLPVVCLTDIDWVGEIALLNDMRLSKSVNLLTHATFPTSKPIFLLIAIEDEKRLTNISHYQTVKQGKIANGKITLVGIVINPKK